MYPEESLSNGDRGPQRDRQAHGLSQWWRQTKHREATAVEQIVPIVFVVVYIALLVRVITQ
jgi:hypothetical protein